MQQKLQEIKIFMKGNNKKKIIKSVILKTINFLQDSRFALCTEFVGGQWRMLFMDTLEQFNVPHFLGAEQGKWFTQLWGEKWYPVEPSQMACFDVRLDELDKECCLKVFHFFVII